MIEEIGTVIDCRDEIAEVAIERTEACAGCSAKSMCQPFGEKENRMIISAINNISAKKGNKVKVAVPSTTFIKASFIVYIVPVIFMLIGAFIGEIYFKNDIVIFILSGLFFIISFFIISKYSKLNKKIYTPVITEIL